MKYMLDTNICIYAIKNKPENVLMQIKRHISDGLCISSITLAELQHGVEKSSNPEKNYMALMQFLSILDILPFGSSAAIEYGKICAHLQKAGTVIGTMDMLIAAHAKVLGLTVVTNNSREFQRVPELMLENWTMENQ